MNAGRENSSLTPKKAAKPAENFNSDACHLCGINFKISVGDFGGKNKYISTENLFKILQRAGVDKIPLADLLKIHLDIKVDPRDGKSSRVCAKCALKIRNASILIEFITTALNRQNTDEVSVMCPLRNSAIGKGKGTKTKPEKAANVLALCSSALAKFRNEKTSMTELQGVIVIVCP